MLPHWPSRSYAQATASGATVVLGGHHYRMRRHAKLSKRSIPPRTASLPNHTRSEIACHDDHAPGPQPRSGRSAPSAGLRSHPDIFNAQYPDIFNAH